jgi:hypothetical protein
MSSRLLALLLLLAVLPSVEVGEQLEHAVVHLLDGEAPDHSAHHEQQPGDEHGCTGLIHLCSCHHAQVTAAFVVDVTAAIRAASSQSLERPRDLVGLGSLEPPHRPPIA